jgi:hypothetical protein
MKRVQVILEEWQHDWLATEAERLALTVSALLRQLLTESIERRQAAQLQDDSLWGIIGMAEGPDDGITSENLDTFLYRIPSPPPLRLVAEAPTAKEAGYGAAPASDR